jgi:hypothetical protein
MISHPDAGYSCAGCLLCEGQSIAKGTKSIEANTDLHRML